MLCGGIVSELEALKKISIRDFITKFANFVEKLNIESAEKRKA